MQTSTLPIQVTGAAPANALQRPNTGSGAGEFGATLAREMAQRSAPPAAPQAPRAPQPQQAQAAKPQQPDNAQPDEAQASAQAPASAASAPDGGKAQAADASAEPAEQGANDASDAASSPAADMLALMASFSQLQKAAAGAGKDAKDTLPALDDKADSGQATLQATLKRLVAQDGASASHAAAASGALADRQQQAAFDVPAGAAQKEAAGAGIDLRAAFAPDARTRTEPAADFGAKAREIAAKLETIAPTAAPVQPQLQAAAVEAARPAVAAAGEHLSARVGTSAWDNQVGQKIVWMVGSEEQTASLTLNPPDLGPMQVVLSVTGDQASVAFSASHEDVRHALESALPRLREMMSESGIALGSATVSTGTPDQRQAQGGQAGGGARGNGFADDANGSDASPQVATRTTVLGDGMVDTFA